MKLSRNTAIIASALMLCLALSSCGKSQEVTENKEPETPTPQQELEAVVENTEILSVKKDGGGEVNLGDSADAIEKALGKPDKKSDFSLEYEGITIYLAYTVNMITVKTDDYIGYGGIRIGDSIDSAKKAFKKDEYYLEEQKDIGFFRITLAADENGSLISSPTEADTITAPYLYIVTSNNYGKENTITHIQLKDNRDK